MNLFELFVKIGVKDEASKKLANISDKLGSGLKTAAKIGTAAVSAVSSGIAALGTYAAKVGGDFEAQMSKVSAISGATGDDLQALEDKAKQLGIDTKFSATEAGQAFEYMAMAGWKTEQMLDGVAGVMDLAAASGEDLAMVSDIVTDAMTAFGLSADQSTHFADVLAQASSNANTNVALLGESFKYVAPVAGALGYSVEDTATALGLMANAGIKGSQAGTALRAALSSMLDASDPVYTAMMQLGLATEDTVTALVNEDGTSKSLAETMGILREAFSGLTEAEQAEYAANIFGREAMSGMLAIINTSDEDFEKLTNSIYSADGAAKQMADTMANNLQGKLTLLKSSAEGFGLALYDKIQTPLTEMASWGVESLNKLTTAFNEKGVDGVVEAAGKILSEAIKEIVNGLPKFVDLAIQIIDSFIGGLNDNLDTIVNGAISVIVTFADGILNMLPEIIKLGLDLLVSLANGIAESLPSLIPTVMDVILQIVETLLSPESINNIIDAALNLITSLAAGLLAALPKLIEKVPEIIITLVNTLISKLPEILTTGVDILVALIDGIVSAIPQLVAMMPEILMGIVGGIISNLDKLIPAAIEVMVKLGTSLVGAIPKLLTYIPTIFSDIVSSFKSQNWGSIGTNLVAGFKTGISNAWKNLKTWFTSLFGDLKSIAKQILGIKSPSREFKKIGLFTVEGLEEGLEEDAEAPIKTIEGISKRMMNAFDPSFSADYITSYDGYGSSAYGGSSSDYSSEEASSIVNITFGEKSIYVGQINGDNESDIDSLTERIIDKMTEKIQSKGAVFA